MSWWPYGEAAEKLARAVLSGDLAFARRHAQAILDEADRMAEFKKIESELARAIDACRWDECDRLLAQLERVGVWATNEVVRYQTIVAFERDTTVLDRLVQETSE